MFVRTQGQSSRSQLVRQSKFSYPSRDGERNQEQNVEIQQEGHEDLNEISTREVNEALKNMRSGKATDDDELPLELLKAAGKDVWSG